MINLNQILLLVVAVILLGIRLPSFMDRQEMSKADKIVVVLFAFSLLGLAWFAIRVFSMFI